MAKTVYAQHPKVTAKDICGRCHGEGRVVPQIRRRNVTDVCFACHGSGVNSKALDRLQLDVLTLGQRVIVRGVVCEITGVFASLPLEPIWSNGAATGVRAVAPTADFKPEYRYIVNLPGWREATCGTVLDGVTCRPDQMVPAS